MYISTKLCIMSVNILNVFGTLADSGTQDAAESLNNKLDEFLYKTVYRECQYLQYLFFINLWNCPFP